MPKITAGMCSMEGAILALTGARRRRPNRSKGSPEGRTATLAEELDSLHFSVRRSRIAFPAYSNDQNGGDVQRNEAHAE